MGMVSAYYWATNSSIFCKYVGDAMKRNLLRFLYALLPMVECNSANKLVKQEQNTTWNKIVQEVAIEDIEIFAGIEEGDAKDLLKGIHEKISSLQDKAKVTAV